MCNRECRQGRDCDCGPAPMLVTGIGVIIWVACFVYVCALIYRVW